jgi:hypothetical protein
VFYPPPLGSRVVLNSDAPMTSPATNALEGLGGNGCLRKLYAHFLDWSRLHFINLHFSFLGSVALDSDIVAI